MNKKIILGFVTFALAAGTYILLSMGDRRPQPTAGREASTAVRDFGSLPSTLPGHTIGDAGMRLRPGDHTLVRVYDDVTGQLKYELTAKQWEPVSETEFHVEDLLIQICRPRGEITYVSADSAEVTIARRSGNRFEPKRGRLMGNVKIVIDRTTSAWREANPEFADRDAHPEDLVNVYLEDATFDLEQAEMKSDGAVLVDGHEARIEDVEGLTLQWNQADNRIDVLRFRHGGRMLLRRGGRMIDFGMPGTIRDATASDEPGASVREAGPARPEHQRVPRARAQAMKPMSIEAVSAEQAAAEIRREGGFAVANRPKSLPQASPAGADVVRGAGRLRSAEDLAADVAALRAEARAGTSGKTMQLDALVSSGTDRIMRIHTYRAVFNNGVLVEQKEGLRTIGKLEADTLEINFDFGPSLRRLAGPRHRQRVGPSSNAAATRPADALPSDREPGRPPLEKDRTKLVLEWDGPLEMRPLRVDPSEQTGQRFDAIATGRPVRVKSDRGSARCDQMVYRHERRQVWLSGTDARPVEMWLEASRRLVGREVFFDQARGLARVDGSGSMVAERLDLSETGGAAGGVFEARLGVASSTLKTASGAAVSAATHAPRVEDGAVGVAPHPGGDAGERNDRVEIRWTRGVDIELGYRTVKWSDPSSGVEEDKQREFLQRAWFHGDVSVKRNGSRLFAEEVAATFGLPLSGAEPADHIEHLNMSGNVRLFRDDDLILADRLDVEMEITPEGDAVRSEPKIVNGEGRVLVRQGQSEFRAEQMRVVLEPTRRGGRVAANSRAAPFGEWRSGIRSLEASGSVYVNDPVRNLRIRKAEELACAFRNGNELIHATIVSTDPAVFARVRLGEFGVHGHRIEIDMDNESMDVPGPGRAWMTTERDFSGRELRRPAPVKIRWTSKAEFRLARNYALFVGGVRSETRPAADDTWRCAGLNQAVMWDLGTVCTVAAAACKHPQAGRLAFGLARRYRAYGRFSREMDAEWRTFGLDCDKLTVRFAGIPPAKRVAETRGVLDRFPRLATVLGETSRDKSSAAMLPPRMQKRPVHVVADGRAAATSVARAPRSPRGKLGRLRSRVTIKGDRIEADLARKQMSVPGPGSLVIEDYRFEAADRRRRAARSPLARGPLMSALGEEGASQTAVKWANTMDFFVDRNLIAFDRDVRMAHRSGRRMVMQQELAEAMELDPSRLRDLGTGREAMLTCGFLLLEFLVEDGPGDRRSEAAPAVRATDLKRLIAKHAVNLREGTKNLMGAYLQYLHETNEVRLEGSETVDARIIDQDEATQRLRTWKGRLVIWNRQTNRIEALGTTVRTSRR